MSLELPEEVPVVGHPDFIVTRQPVVRNTKTGADLRSRVFGDYPVVDIEGKTTNLHSIVCTSFHGPRPCKNCVIHHKNENKRDARPENLEWVSRKEHSLRHGNALCSDARVRKPHPSFPLFPGQNRQWVKAVWDRQRKKSIPHYFGSVCADPTGEFALRRYREWERQPSTRDNSSD
jgi:hypothetical protein